MSSENNTEINLLKAKLESQKKDKTIYLLVGLIVGAIAGFFVTDHLDRSATGASAAAVQPSNPGVTDLPAASGDLPKGHPDINGGTAGAPGQGGPIPEVQAALKKAKDNPNDADAQIAAAAMYYRIQQYDGALTYLKRAHDIKPEDYDANLGLANVYYDLKRFSEALPFYEKASKMKPEDTDVRTDLGTTYRQLGQTDKAVAEYKKSLAVDPKHENTLFNLATIYLEQGDARNAEEMVNRLTQAAPGNQGLPKLKSDLEELKTKGKIPTH